MILQGNAIDNLKKLESQSIDCIVTSPPYYQLRQYGDCNNEIGHEPEINVFIDKLVDVFMESHRVLKDDGTMWIVIGDTFNTTKSKHDLMISKQTYKNFDFRTNDRNISEKSLVGVPERLMIALIDKGWICRNNIIWHKPNAMPNSVKDRFTVDYENILFFTKSKKYYFNQLKEPMKTTDLNRPRGSKGVLGPKNSGSRDLDVMSNNLNMMRNKRAVWSINTKASSINHFAMFPEELIEEILEAGCKPKGIVLDMFAGAGTTLKVAKKNGFNYLGIELYEKNCKIIKKRLKATPVVYKLF